MKKSFHLVVLILLLFTSVLANESIEKAKEYMEKKEFAEAKQILEKIIAEDEQNHEAFYNLAQVYLAEWNLDKATEYAERAVEIAEETPDYHFLLGRIYGYDARSASIFRKPFLAKDCKNAFLRTLELDPNHLDGNMGLAEFMFYAPGIAGGDKEEAVKIAEKVISIDEASGLNLLTKYQLDDGKIEEAKKGIDRLIELDEIRGRLRLLGYLYIEKDTTGIMNEFVTLETLIGENSDYFWFYNRYGNALLKLGNPEEALNKFKTLVKLSPKLAFGYNSLGNAYFELKNYDEALKQYKKALEIDPDFDDAEDRIDEIEDILENNS